MATHLERLAKRLEDDPYFLACPLRHHADIENVEVVELARALGCSEENLNLIRLSRAPRLEPAEFREDIDHVAARFQVDPDALAAMVRSGQAIYHMGRIAIEARGTLMAARDVEQSADTEPKGDDR